MSKVIIGIHGRANKPEPETLKQWWKTSIEDGLSVNLSQPLGREIDFEMVYYADTYYEKPSQLHEVKFPYRPVETGSLKRYQQGFADRLRKITGDWLDNPLDWAEKNTQIFSRKAQVIMGAFLNDLATYYADEKRKQEIKEKLRAVILERRDDQIFLISHSMGCIVAYDVLREIGRDPAHKDVSVEHFVTLGSPLGLTPIKSKTAGFHNQKLRTPSCVRNSWVNFADPQDIVALDSHLADDYTENSSFVKVQDVMVCNDYLEDPHKSLGYLRTPEFSDHLAQFT